MTKLTDLIAAATWREAVTFRETWPHEYVLLQKDGERELMKAVCQRVQDGEAFQGYFFKRQIDYVFVGDHKYWFMWDGDAIMEVLENEDDEREVVLNRARLYHDRRDFYIQFGDTGMRDDYPGPPWWMERDQSRSTSDDDN